MSIVNCPSCGNPANQIIDRAPDGTEKLIVQICLICQRGKVIDHDHPIGKATIISEQLMQEQVAKLGLNAPNDERFYRRYVPG